MGIFNGVKEVIILFVWVWGWSWLSNIVVGWWVLCVNFKVVGKVFSVVWLYIIGIKIILVIDNVLCILGIEVLGKLIIVFFSVFNWIVIWFKDIFIILGLLDLWRLV